MSRIKADEEKGITLDEAMEDEDNEGMMPYGEEGEEGYKQFDEPHSIIITPVPSIVHERYDLEPHIKYTPEKVLEMLMDLKSQVCCLTNKSNALSRIIFEQESLHAGAAIQDLQEQLREVRYYTTNLKEGHEFLDSKIIRTTERLTDVNKLLDELKVEKVEKHELEQLLADKVSFRQLQNKVSYDQIQELQCRIEKQQCETFKLLNDTERNLLAIIDDLRTTLGFDAFTEHLQQFQDKILQDVKVVQEALEQFIKSTNEDCLAAGARYKVLQDLSCISCDTTCVMRTTEKSKVGKLPNAQATPLISPLITYELSSIRKSGIMGYYRKDEFPNSPHGWLSKQTTNMTACIPRHSGGSHTSHTAKEHVERVLLNKRQKKTAK